ncbi:DUF2934 domain-containing protein [Sediminicoccus rosea]|uniref:DUF2934 domain-containing protein n=1 Tax=Sediminicoccus rosea TaxID=1225128 RepID=A0ABZ0PF90_9PROT|nr:DUF2934 domain-containing protein [Sediminicoccus rosea]WPB84363.1 DUF2934 domain-containing protein [Sediminicoccus rosea]
MTLHDDSLNRVRTERLAYQLWQEAGCPEGQAERYWREAEGLIAAAPPEPGLPARAPSPAMAAAASPQPEAAPAETGWGAAAARYFAAWWAYPSKPAER